MNKLIVFFGCLGICFNGEAQSQFEFSITNTVSIIRKQGTRPSEDNADMEGGALDLYRNSLLININRPIGKKSFFSYGICYSIHRYAFVELDAGMSGGPHPTPYNNDIFQKYQSLAPFFGLKTKWMGGPLNFYIGLNLFPEFIWGQKGTYYIDGRLEIVDKDKAGFSHLNSRVNLSICSGKEKKNRFVLNLFFQPPGIYLTQVIRERITYINAGIGLGWIFGIHKKAAVPRE